MKVIGKTFPSRCKKHRWMIGSFMASQHHALAIIPHPLLGLSFEVSNVSVQALVPSKCWTQCSTIYTPVYYQYLLPDNCYSFNTFANTIELISDPKLLEPFISLESLESIPIKFMTNTECRRFLAEETDQYHKEIMCTNTTNYGNRLRTFEQYKVSQL